MSKKNKPKLAILRWENGFVNPIRFVNFGMPGAMLPQEIEHLLPKELTKEDVDVVIYDVASVKEGWEELMKEKK